MKKLKKTREKKRKEKKRRNKKKEKICKRVMEALIVKVIGIMMLLVCHASHLLSITQG